MIAAILDFFDNLIKLMVVAIVDLPTAVAAIINGVVVLAVAFLLMRLMFLALIPKIPNLDRDFRLLLVEEAAVVFTMGLVLLAGWVAYIRGYLSSLAFLTGHLLYLVLLSLMFALYWQNYRTKLRALQQLQAG